ncbi:cytochrome c peroxidase [Litorivivens lipolytica]|uniref:Cytochrome c peroxidase n=1 Tax=Litorivivens lipolytica TaxID=1524264 RepID=A0A7W4W1Y9_9GAMM|nr:cytochrome c peroxidase [Litorivivens lipolytica]
MKHYLLLVPAVLMLLGCRADDSNSPSALSTAPVGNSALDEQLRPLINHLSGNPAAGRGLPGIEDPLAQLGMRLFFSKSLGGDFDSACVTCHHPALGGGDNLSLSVGVGAENPDVLGVGRKPREGAPLVPRNAPTTFNIALWDRSLFHDSRVENLTPQSSGPNGEGAAIRTPDSPFGVVDPYAGQNLTVAQARFPITSKEEMRGEFDPHGNNDSCRDLLAARIGDYGAGAGELARNEWLGEFQTAFQSSAPAEELITYDNIALALAEYERSQTFVDIPWNDYVRGDVSAISDSAKRGAILFFTSSDQGGANCSACHSGDFFTDEGHHIVAFPQIGVGKGDGAHGDDDFGRMRESGQSEDRYRFRTPTLLNIALTAPYGHAGAYATLEAVVRHYNDPVAEVNRYFDGGGWCSLPQFEGDAQCSSHFPNARANSELALDELARERSGAMSKFPAVDLSEQDIADLVAFLNTLTDRCAADADCIQQWIPPRDGGPDDQQLAAVDAQGAPL